MRKGDKLFVRIDHRVEGNAFGATDFDDHIEYLEGVAKERHFMGGGFANTIGGMIVFKAKDYEEAKAVADGDPLIIRKLYTYDLFEWDLAIVSEE